MSADDARARIDDEQWRALIDARATRPEAVAQAYTQRKRADTLLSERGTILLVAADHPARGALGPGADAMAMADRRELLERLVTALSHPDVDGVLGGAPGPDPAADLASWGRTLRQPVVRGLVVGGTLLYPPDGDVWSAVDAAARLLRAAAE